MTIATDATAVTPETDATEGVAEDEALIWLPIEGAIAHLKQMGLPYSRATIYRNYARDELEGITHFGVPITDEETAAPDREIAECNDVIEHVRHRSADAFRNSQFLADAKERLIARGEPARGSALEDELARVRRKYEEARLAEAGKERANYWGWPNTYTYTKSIGEQILSRDSKKGNLFRICLSDMESSSG